MQAMSVEALVILGLILTNGLLAMSRSAIESAKKSRLNNWSSQGDRAASAALRLSEDPRRLDWTVQLLVTVLTTFIGVYAGTTLVPATGKAIGGFGGLAEYKSIPELLGRGRRDHAGITGLFRARAPPAGFVSARNRSPVSCPFRSGASRCSRFR